MTYYVLALIRAIRGYGGGKQPIVARLSDDPAWTSAKKPVLLIGKDFDQPMPPTQVLGVDGSPEARKFAAKGGYKAVAEPVGEIWQTVILKDRAAAGGRATKGIMTPRKQKAIAKNARLGGRPSLDAED